MISWNDARVKKLVYLGLGSNLGDRQAHLEAAIKRIAELGTIVAQSSFYETEPVDMAPSPSGAPQWFLNAALALETELMPKQLLGRLLDIERTLGRKRSLASQAPKTPRTIDLDILLFGSSIVEAPGLVIPHPAMHLRRFVLEPLAEIAPETRHPVFKRTMKELRDALPKEPGKVKKVQ
jgi:2-amino-4-hydroxy-6-hydroxymethyldihydropteridine diphosphokinase